jgi:hypothetical protein
MEEEIIMKRLFLSFVIGGIIFYSTPARGQITIPHTFQSGTPANASEVNENFQALKAGIESQIPQSISGDYDLPFSTSGALSNRNVLVLKYLNPSDNSIQYRCYTNFYNSEGFTISTNAVPSVYDYISMYIDVNVDSGGNITSITKIAFGMDTPFGSSYTMFLEVLAYNPNDLSQIIYSADTDKYYVKKLNTPRQSVPHLRFTKHMLSADDTVQRVYPSAYLYSFLGESIELNGMSFSDVVMRVELGNSDYNYNFNLYAKDIGLIQSYNSGTDTSKEIIYYRVNGTSGGNLIGTPFASGGDLAGLFFSP